jgi:NAD(P)-dependent dehydrogenase (short-subunit alcohol dehydrogenase family)
MEERERRDGTVGRSMGQGAVLVTGASSGIGLQTALLLAGRGFEVYATMRDPSRGGDLLEEAEKRELQIQILPLDLSQPLSIENALNRVLSQSGRIYGLVNNAGIQLRGYFEDLTDEEIRHIFEINTYGTMAVTKALIPHLRANRRGRIVIVSSIGGRIGSPALSAYCASKFALEGFGEALALELQSFGISVSMVEPAIVNTPIWGQNRNVATHAEDPSSPYSAWFRQSERLADQLVQSSPTTSEDVADAIYAALTDRRPKLRYLVGRRAALVLTLRRILPEVLFERLYFGEVVRRITQTKN